MYTLHTLTSLGTHNNLGFYSIDEIKDCNKDYNNSKPTSLANTTNTTKPFAFSYPNLESEFQSQACAQNRMKIQTNKSRISKKGKEHDAFEDWLGRHNRKFEILRTLTSIISASASSIILLKLFGAI